MKTLILTFLLIFGLSAVNHGKPIKDIYSIKEPVIEEESYVNDIPFDTWEVAVDAILEGDELKLEEEPYVNDIPFDTRKIACKYVLLKMIETNGEANVNDIPFNTEKIYCEHMAKLLTEEYRNEKMVKDLPENSNHIFFANEKGLSSCFSLKDKSPKQSIFRHKSINNYDYSIIYPVKFELPEIEFRNDIIENEIMNNEVLVKPGFSL